MRCKAQEKPDVCVCRGVIDEARKWVQEPYANEQWRQKEERVEWWRNGEMERERDRFVGCHYTRKKTPMRDSRRTYAANPSTETGRNSKKGTNVLTEIYKFSATLHPYLRRPSFLTDTVQMLPLVNSSFFVSSTHNLSETGPSRTWVDRLCRMLSS